MSSLTRREKKNPSDTWGFTLVEVMIAAIVLFLVAIGVLAVFLQAYRLTLITRHNDNAMAVLAAMGDRFARLNPIVDADFFAPTVAVSPYGTGEGITWNNTVGDANGCLVVLGERSADTDGRILGSTVEAHLFRNVVYVDVVNGAVSGVNQGMRAATFTLRYQIKGDWKTQQITIAREIPQ